MPSRTGPATRGSCCGVEGAVGVEEADDAVLGVGREQPCVAGGAEAARQGVHDARAVAARRRRRSRRRSRCRRRSAGSPRASGSAPRAARLASSRQGRTTSGMSVVRRGAPQRFSHRAAGRWRTRGRRRRRRPRPGSPARRAALAGEATTCRTSPSRYCPVTTGSGPPQARGQLAGQVADGVRGAARDVVRRRAPPPRVRPAGPAGWPRATSRTCTKSRRWPPSSKTRGASPRSSARAEEAGDAGVRGVLRHVRAVDVVVPQRDGRAAAAGAGPGGGQVLLRGLAWRRRRCAGRAARPPGRCPGRAAARRRGRAARSRPASRSACARGPGRTTPCSAQA